MLVNSSPKKKKKKVRLVKKITLYSFIFLSFLFTSKIPNLLLNLTYSLQISRRMSTFKSLNKKKMKKKGGVEHCNKNKCFFFLSHFINPSKCSVYFIFILKENVHHFKSPYFSRNNYTFVQLISKENKPIQITIPNKHAKKSKGSTSR